MPEAYVVAARRTPIAGRGRALRGYSATALAAPVLRALYHDLGGMGFADARIDDVILGNARGPGGNIARIAALEAGLGLTIPGTTVDRQCGSGLEAVRLGAGLVKSGMAHMLLVGGTESASQGDGLKAAFTPAEFPDPDMGVAADAMAHHLRLSRKELDAYSASSHSKALQCQRRGIFDAEVVPFPELGNDDRPRPLTPETLSRLRPAFTQAGPHTAGNSCGINDGAAAIALTSKLPRPNTPALRIVDSTVVGVDPALPGLGALAAITQLFDTHGLTQEDISAFEITEAFAAVAVGTAVSLGLDPTGSDADRYCAQGGAIALGHPWGASGALLLVRLFSQLVTNPVLRPNTSSAPLGIAAASIGGGIGLAVLVERVVAPSPVMPGNLRIAEFRRVVS